MAEEALQQEKHEFKTELKQLLHIITHSLYSNREIFLRELISNSSDAISKLKFDSLEQEEKLEGDKDWKIKLIPDAEKGTLTIADNGIGMSRETIVDQLGTIAKSGTKAFLEQIKAKESQSDQVGLIGQFGVGFYSAYMVADKVTVHSRLAGDPPEAGITWESEGQGEYTVEPCTREKRGTEVVLHLKEDCKEFLEEWKLRHLVRQYSNFLEHPVVMDVVKKEDDKEVTTEEALNSRDAIWLRRKQDVTEEEYNEFYKQISHDMEDPLSTIHYSVEGAQEYKVLLFIPAKQPFEFRFNPADIKTGPRLYVQRVQIMDHCEELIPPYLRFVKGVVDSSDLPLNISREILQHTRMLDAMQKDIVRRVLKELKWLMEEKYEQYCAWFTELGSLLKEGVAHDHSNREALADLLLLESLKTPKGEWTTLAKYVEAKPEDQKEIFYLTGESRGVLESSPYLEAFRKKEQDVLLLTDPIDEIVVNAMTAYKEIPLKAIDRGDIEQEDKPSEEAQKQYEGLIAYLKDKLTDLEDVRLTTRLHESAACLVVPEGAMTAHVERLMAQMGQSMGGMSKRILEINPEHPAIQGTRECFEKNSEDPRLETYARLIYDQAVLTEGSKIEDPSHLARRINELIARDAKS